mmetsp:Transcript_16801/g.52158  ORF Transcript_16801/g.52158 Transcript_16801/m.52158 type:complete len:201 (-) Transcript_16801:25-627(-)
MAEAVARRHHCVGHGCERVVRCVSLRRHVTSQPTPVCQVTRAPGSDEGRLRSVTVECLVQRPRGRQLPQPSPPPGAGAAQFGSKPPCGLGPRKPIRAAQNGTNGWRFDGERWCRKSERQSRSRRGARREDHAGGDHDEGGAGGDGLARVQAHAVAAVFDEERRVQPDAESLAPKREPHATANRRGGPLDTRGLSTNHCRC